MHRRSDVAHCILLQTADGRQTDDA